MKNVMSWTKTPIHVIDFEGSLGSGILEYGVVSWRGGDIVETRTRLCRPAGRIRERDAATHGIRAGGIASGTPPFDADWEFFREKRRNGPFAAHFASVENALIKAVWSYPGEAPDFSGTEPYSVEWGPWVDTGRLMPRLFDGLPGAGLQDLIGAFSLQDELDALAREHCPENRRSYHCALYDALASALLLGKASAYPQFRDRSLRWLFEMSAGSDAKGEGFRQGRLL